MDAATRPAPPPAAHDVEYFPVESRDLWLAKFRLVEQVSNPQLKILSVKAKLPDMIKQNGVVSIVKNETVLEREQAEQRRQILLPVPPELTEFFPRPQLQGLTAFHAAREKFNKLIIKAIKKLRHDTRLSVYTADAPDDRPRRGRTIVVTLPEAEQVFLYTANDLLKAVERVAVGNISDSMLCPPAVALFPALTQPHDFRRTFAELALVHTQSGMDDALRSWAAGSRFAATRQTLGENNILGSVEELRGVARRGLPNALRAQCWQIILGAAPTPADAEFVRDATAGYFRGAPQTILELLVASDVSATCLEENYFIFAETTTRVTCALLMEPQVRKRLEALQTRRVFPSGILPCKGLASLVAPLSFLTEDAGVVFALARALYLRFFHHLHELNSHEQSFPALLAVFLSCLEQAAPCLREILEEREFDLLEVVAEWIACGFSGFLQPAQWLTLWDRIVGFDNLLLLPILAAAILTFRAPILITLKDPRDIQHTLNMMSSIEVVPLLQGFLFG